MARILVQSGTVPGAVAIIQDTNQDPDSEPWWTWTCFHCFRVDSDRGHFEDTVMSADNHVDRCTGPVLA